MIYGIKCVGKSHEITRNRKVFAALGISRDSRDADVNEDRFELCSPEMLVAVSDCISSCFDQKRIVAVQSQCNSAWSGKSSNTRNRKLLLINRLLKG